MFYKDYVISKKNPYINQHINEPSKHFVQRSVQQIVRQHDMCLFYYELWHKRIAKLKQEGVAQQLFNRTSIPSCIL